MRNHENLLPVILDPLSVRGISVAFPRSEECDCACPISLDQKLQWHLETEIDRTAKYVCGSDIVEVPLDSNYRALFNPYSQGGVIVINGTAYRIYDAFRRPLSLEEISSGEFSYVYGLERSIQQLTQFGIIHPQDRDRQHHFETSKILTAWLHITNACSLRCSYCYLQKNREEMDESTGKAAIDAIVKSAISHGFQGINLKYAGGEPTLNYRLILTLHDYARKLTLEKGLELRGVILSNGISFSSKMIEEMKSRHIEWMISLDGIGEFHNSQRKFETGKPSFGFVEKTINQLIAFDSHPHLSITITGRNHAGIPDVVLFALKRQLTFSLNFFRDTPGATQENDLRYDEQQMIDSLFKTFAVIEKNLPPWSILGAVLDRGQLVQPRQRPCGVGQEYIVVDQRGRIAKCHMEIEKTIGNVFEDDPVLLVRQNQDDVRNIPVNEKEGCRDCTWRYWCSGGCPAATYQVTGRYDVASPNCNIYKAIYPAAIRLEGLRLLKYANVQ